uniref:B2 mating type protein n=1 Tax=Heterobasidion parviporum TaxID=207832 RepID=S5RF65_9AGAM|nr:b2 mating type protein [Heterobasidion parviporum]
MSFGDRLRAIAHIAESSTWYQTSSNDISRFVSTAANVPSVLPTSEVVEYTFVLPKPLTADFLALGLSEATSKQLSSNYLRASMELKAAYEAEFRRSTTTCLQVIRAFRLPLPDLQALTHSTYASRYTSTVNLWAEKQISVTRQKLMQATLSARYYATSLSQTSAARTRKSAPVTEKKVCSSQTESNPSKSRFHKVKIESMILEAPSHEFSSKSDNEPGGICNVVELTPSFLSQSSVFEFENDNLSQHEAPSHAFPTVYHPLSLPSRRDSCLKILSHGLRRTISSQTTSMDSLIQAFGRVLPEALSDCKSSWGTNGSCDPEEGTAGHSPARSSPSSLSSDVSVKSPPAVLKPPVFITLTSFRDSRDSLEPPSVSLSPQHPVFKAHRQCKASAMPTLHLPTSTNARLPQSLSSISVASSPRVKKPEPPFLAITVPNTASTSVSRRKVAKLPTRRAPTSTSTLPTPAPPTPNPSSLAPLNVANVSSLSRPSFPSTRSRSTISRTPSLVSLASSDSESSSPFSDGLDTPPSTPPPFVTKFPSSISPSSLSSKSFTPTFDSAVSPGNIFQFSSTKQLKVFEAHLPSGAPPYSSPTGIKREEVSFSFAFSR